MEQGTSLSQQMQSQLASFDRQTRNYSPSLTTELPPSSQNPTTVSTNVASGHPPDVLLVLADQPFGPSASSTADSGNQHVPVAEVRQSEENAHAAGTSYINHLLSPSYDSEDESPESRSPNGGANRTPNRVLDIDEDEEFDEVDEHSAADVDEEDEVDEYTIYSNDESIIDDDFRSRGYQEDFESDDRSEPAVGPEGAFADSDSDSGDSRHADGEPIVHTDRRRRALQDVEEGDNYSDVDEDDDDVLPSDATTGGSQIARRARDQCAGNASDQPAYSRAGHGTADLSEENGMSVRLRLNVSAGWSVGAASDAPAGDAAAAEVVAGDRYHDTSRGFSDDNDDEDASSGHDDNAASRHDVSDDSSSEYRGRQQTARRRRSVSSTSASPSQQHHDVDVGDGDSDDDAGRRNSVDNAEAAGGIRNLHSRSNTRRRENRRSVSRASSTTGSSRSSVYEHRGGQTLRDCSADSSSDGRWSYLSSDSDDSSVTPPPRRRRRGVKRLRSVGSATDSDSRGTDAGRRQRKLHRLR